jgi:phosphoribosylcarboxyaminoimidazole (NCAIR) mutase
MRQDIIFGSTSDEEKVLPGVIEATKRIPGLEVMVHYASADNTPDKVKDIMEELRKGDDAKAFLSGAGMANVLTGVVKTYSLPTDLVVGVPITDSKTEGTSSFLSTGEKLPGNPVLMVGLNNSYAALNIANRFRQGYDLSRQIVVNDSDTIDTPQEFIDGVTKALEKIGLNYELRPTNAICPDDIVVNPFYVCDRANIQNVDRALRDGKGIQIGVCIPLDYEGPDGDTLRDYAKCLDGTEATGVVSIASYANAVQMAAILTHNKSAVQFVVDSRREKVEDLANHKGLYVANGKVKEVE